MLERRDEEEEHVLVSQLLLFAHAHTSGTVYDINGNDDDQDEY